jgi:hypothetical protein
VNALAGAPAARALAFPGLPEGRAPREDDARAAIRDPYVLPPHARASTALRATEGRPWAPVRGPPVSGGQAVQQAATRDHRSRARRVPAAPLEAAPVSTGLRARGRRSARSSVPGQPAVGGLRVRRDPEPSRAASPGTPSGRTTTGPARPEQRSQPEPTGFARQHSPRRLHRQRNKEASRDSL